MVDYDDARPFRQPVYLRGEQYAAAENLDARTKRHSKFTTTSLSLFTWIQQLFQFPLRRAGS